MAVVCGSCPVGGKSIIFNPATYGIQLTFNVIVHSGHSGSGVIQVQTWSQKPNNNLTGRVWYKDLVSGEILQITPASNKIGISFFQRNPSKSNFWDCCCADLDNINSLITIRSF